MRTNDDLIRLMQQIANQRDIPMATTGVVVPNSFDPVRGTVQVMVGSTAAISDPTDLDEPTWVNRQPVQVLTGHVGQQGGPIGLERVVLIPVDDGWRALFEHDADDSPHALPGEWRAHLRDIDPARVLACYLAVGQAHTRVAHEQTVVIMAPIILLGSEIPIEGEQIVRKVDDQLTTDRILQNVQEAITQLARTVQPGTGVPPPTIQPVEVTASERSYSG